MLRKSKYQIFLKFLFIVCITIYFLFYIGRKYLKRLNTFIYENNNIIIKNELNSFINEISYIDYNEFYQFNYNDEGEIIGASYNSSNINKSLGTYINNFKKNISYEFYNKYIDKYFRSISTRNETYFLVPIGFISDNPFIYNLGPSVILSYNFISSFNFNLDFDVKNYGLNNVLINLYLNVDINQSITKPVLKSTNKSSYRFLLSSQIVYGRVSNFLSSGFSIQSENI